MSHSIKAFRAAQERLEAEEAAMVVQEVQAAVRRGQTSLSLLADLPLGAVERAVELLTAGGMEGLEASASTWGLNVGWLNQVTFTWQAKRRLTVVK